MLRELVKRLFLFQLLVGTTLALAASEERRLLARFELKGDGRLYEQSPAQKTAVIFYQIGDDVEIQGVGEILSPVSLGPFKSRRLLEKLSKIELPKIDYQKHFDGLRGKVSNPGTGASRPGRGWIVIHGNEVEVEMHIRGIDVRFRTNDPESFLFSYDDDKAASAVSAAIDAFILTIGGRTLLF